MCIRDRSNEAPKQANYRGIGLAEMIDSMENKRKHRCNGELALHVLDLIECTMLSSSKMADIQLRTTCMKPESLGDDSIRKLLKVPN